MSAVLEKPTWALVGVFPLTNDQMALDRLKVVLDESDEEYFKELTQYYRSIRQPEFTPEKHREAMIYLEQHPLRNMLLQRLVFWTSRNQSLRMIIDKDKIIQWPKINWPNLENDSGAVCTGTALPSANQVLTDINEIKEKLADCRAVGVIKTYPFYDQELIAEPLKQIPVMPSHSRREDLQRMLLAERLGESCSCGTPWHSALYGSECAKCGEKRPDSAAVQLTGQTELTEKKRKILLTRMINEINRFYYEQIDNGRFSGETVFMITCEQTSATSELALLGERVCEYFNNIFDPEYPRKKFHISTAINHLTSGGLAVFLKWGLHADRANDAEKSTTRSIQHIDIEQVVLP